MLGLSLFFFLLAGMFLPTVILLPQKFVFCFTLGSICFMTAFAMIQGPKDFIVGLFEKDRLPFTAAYIGSILGTLYSCLFLKWYIVIFGFSALQVMSLAWYAATYLPGGRYGVALIYRAVKGIITQGCVPCFKLIVAMFQKLFV